MLNCFFFFFLGNELLFLVKANQGSAHNYMTHGCDRPSSHFFQKFLKDRIAAYDLKIYTILQFKQRQNGKHVCSTSDRFIVTMWSVSVCAITYTLSYTALCLFWLQLSTLDNVVIKNESYIESGFCLAFMVTNVYLSYIQLHSWQITSYKVTCQYTHLYIVSCDASLT